MRMNFEEADMAPELELNQIIWKAVRGPGSVMPPPVRAGFIHGVDEEGEHERADGKAEDTQRKTERTERKAARDQPAARRP
jgi:hypothetical protein